MKQLLSGKLIPLGLRLHRGLYVDFWCWASQSLNRDHNQISSRKSMLALLCILNSCHHGHFVQEHLADEVREEETLPQKLRLWNSTKDKERERGGRKVGKQRKNNGFSFFLPFDPPLFCLLIIKSKKCNLQTLGPSIT